MTPGAGAKPWIGSVEEIERCLSEAHADMDGQHYFILDAGGTELPFLAHDSELLITERVRYFRQGIPHPLLGALEQFGGVGSTSIVVFGDD